MKRLSWEKPGFALFVNARTCGINKDGEEQYKIDITTGNRLEDIDNELLDSVADLSKGKKPKNTQYIDSESLRKKQIYVPTFYDSRAVRDMERAFGNKEEFDLDSLGALADREEIVVMKGHGSPSQDQRVGDIPYVKVSDLRSGLVNINPTNLIPRALAERFWGGQSSGLRAFDLISPERASKNIGEFCVLMPGQESIVLTRETLTLRSTSKMFDQFYLMWAMSLHLVRAQWSRVVFMQTNREDVGSRYLEIVVPVPRSAAVAKKYGRAYRDYFNDLATLRASLRDRLEADGFRHHVFFA